MSPCRDWLKGGIDFCFRSNSRIGSAFILSASSFCCATDLSVPPLGSTCRRACPPNESQQDRDWAKPRLGVLFASSSPDGTSWEAQLCRLRGKTFCSGGKKL